MKPSELREMSDEQLVLTLKDLQQGLFRLRFQAETEELEAPSEMRKAKRDIARMKTILRERELAGAASAEAEPVASAPSDDSAAEERHE